MTSHAWWRSSCNDTLHPTSWSFCGLSKPILAPNRGTLAMIQSSKLWSRMTRKSSKDSCVSEYGHMLATIRYLSCFAQLWSSHPVWRLCHGIYRANDRAERQPFFNRRGRPTRDGNVQLFGLCSFDGLVSSLERVQVHLHELEPCIHTPARSLMPGYGFLQIRLAPAFPSTLHSSWMLYCDAPMQTRITACHKTIHVAIFYQLTKDSLVLQWSFLSINVDFPTSPSLVPRTNLVCWVQDSFPNAWVHEIC